MNYFLLLLQTIWLTLDVKLTTSNSSTHPMNTENVTIPEKRNRQLLPTNFEVTTWEAVKPYFDDLLARDINSN